MPGSKKVKITKGKNWDQLAREDAKDTRCTACNGSGYYDSWNVKKNRPIKCGACNGTGEK